MQTLTLQVQDNFIPNLLNYLEQFKNEVTIKKIKTWRLTHISMKEKNDYIKLELMYTMER